MVPRAARRAIRAQQDGKQVVVVVSARGDTTDELISLAREICEQPPAREMDMLLSTGEQISIALMAMALQALGERAISFTGAQVGIVTDSTHTKARITQITADRVREAWMSILGDELLSNAPQEAGAVPFRLATVPPREEGRFREVIEPKGTVEEKERMAGRAGT